MGAMSARPALAQMATGVQVYPSEGTWTASPHTEISFRGVTREDLGFPIVTGSMSGGHSGILSEHADGNGVSYLPDAHFVPGEVVTVRAEVLPGSEERAHTFGVVRPVAWVAAPVERETEEPEVEPREFRSRPDLRPPVIEVTTNTAQASPGYVIAAAKVAGGQNGGMIVDEEGQLIWFGLPSVTTSVINDLRVQDYQGQPVLTWSESSSPVGFGLGHFVICDTTYQRIAELQVGNGFAGGDLHEFLLTPRGSALVILYHAVEWDLTPIGGSRYGAVIDGIVQEIEVETGRVLFEWHSLDHIALHETRLPFSPDENRDHPFDYFHLNSVDEDADGNLLLSARHTFAIYKVNGDSGDVIWRLHGEQSDFTMGEGTEFAWQHDARMHANGELTLFDNHESNQNLSDEEWSRGVVLDLDEDAMTATLVREYIHPEEVLSISQANMQVLPNGNVFIGWGSAPVFSEFSPDGELVFNGRFPDGGNSYRAYRSPWTAEPVERPALAVDSGPGSTVAVYASWNGATEVASWRVLAGFAPDNLQVVSQGERTGFETEVVVETEATWIAVEALSASGAILGSSEAIETGVS